MKERTKRKSPNVKSDKNQRTTNTNGRIAKKLANQLKDNETTQRCKQWILKQRTVKNKTQPPVEELPSDESDDEYRAIKLDTNDEPTKFPRRSLKSSELNGTKIVLVCEWKKCHAAMDTYDELVNHVAIHTKDSIDDGLIPLKCAWDLCEFLTDSPKLYNSHCAYHAYHTNIKTVGEQMLLEKNPLPACENESHNRNEIPTVVEEYLCMWKDCEYRLATVHEYYAHVRGHCEFEMKMQRVGGRNAQVKCEWIGCEKAFNRMTKTKEHLRTHTGERFLACANCGSTFNSYAKFYDHYKRQAMDCRC